MLLAKALGNDRSKLPAACAQYLDHVDSQSKAWEGASFKHRVSGTTTTAKARPSHAVLQRRMTNPRIANPHAH